MFTWLDEVWVGCMELSGGGIRIYGFRGFLVCMDRVLA